MNETAPCPQCGRLSRLAAIAGPCLACTMGWTDAIPLAVGALRPCDVGRRVTLELEGITITAMLAGLSHSSFGGRGVQLSLGSLDGWMMHKPFPLDHPISFTTEAAQP